MLLFLLWCGIISEQLLVGKDVVNSVLGSGLLWVNCSHILYHDGVHNHELLRKQ